MKIERIINGNKTEIELTGNELCLAYREQQHLFDMKDVRHWLELEEDERELTDEQIDDAAYWAREWMDDNDHMAEIRWCIIDDAIEEVLK